MREINVLVACEESQAVTTELRKGGGAKRFFL